MGRTLLVLGTGVWVVLATFGGIDEFRTTWCIGDYGEPVWFTWNGGRAVCGITGPDVYRFVMYAGLFVGLAMTVVARFATGRRLRVRCAIAAVAPIVAYVVLRTIVALG